MVPVDRSSLPDQVFATLVSAILSGRHAPGARLPSQRALAAELRVNVASIREGIKRLEQLNLVEVRHGDAMRVRDWRRHGGLDVLAHAADHAGSELPPAIMEARQILLTAAARLAAERRSPEQLQRLAHLVERLEATTEDPEAQEYDLAFVAAVVEASGNLVLALIANSLRDVIRARKHAFLAIVGEREALLPLYRRTARAISAGEPGRAAGAAASLASVQQARLLGPSP